MPRLVERAGLTVVGIATVTSNANEMDPATARIAALWARFYGENVPGRIPLKQGPAEPVGVYTGYESDHSGRYELTVGMAVGASAQLPDGLVRVWIQAGKYLLFEAEGEMPGIVIDTWKEVWRHFAKPSGHVRAYTTDFELHRGPNAVEIYISVK